MNNFVFQNPTKILFGKSQIENISKELNNFNKILITFGGGSVKANGVYDRVMAQLKGKECHEFWGIEPNPSVETLREAIALGKEEGVDFVLAVGGGSVADGSKLVAAGIKYSGDAWELVKKGAHADNLIPLGVVITLPATGSEMNSGAVISNKETSEKFPFYSQNPCFSVLEPETTFTLPKYQVACGIADTFVHTTEQYLNVAEESPLMDRWSEGILHTLVEIAQDCLEKENDYESRANFMLCATMALNGFTSMGVTSDWATHMIGHEITALCGITHGHTLTIVMPGLLRTFRSQKEAKILQLGERVFGINSGSNAEKVDATIEAIESFFNSLGLKTNLSENNIDQTVVAEIKRRFNERGVKLGEAKNIDGDMAEKIFANCKK